METILVSSVVLGAAAWLLHRFFRRALGRADGCDGCVCADCAALEGGKGAKLLDRWRQAETAQGVRR